MSLTLKTPSYKPRTDSQPTGAREEIHRLNETLAAVLNAIDLINARIDSLEDQMSVRAMRAELVSYIRTGEWDAQTET